MTHFVIVKNDEELLGHEVPYLSAISTLMYLANCTRLDIVFLSIYLQDTIPLQLEDIGMVSNIYCVIFDKLLI